MEDLLLYIDDTLIYSQSYEAHNQHLRQILKTLRKKLYANMKKCTFCTDHVIFLGYAPSSANIQVDDSKVKAILDWPTPRSILDL